MRRVCFRLQVKHDRLEEYVERHSAVWPEMLEALAATGWHNYSLFLDPSGLLIGYFETPSLEEARAGMAQAAVNSRWQAEMKEFFEDVNNAPDQDFVQLTEVFNLGDQLTRVTLPKNER
jgi:L-rhamnose mutarotase